MKNFKKIKTGFEIFLRALLNYFIFVKFLHSTYLQLVWFNLIKHLKSILAKQTMKELESIMDVDSINAKTKSTLHSEVFATLGKVPHKMSIITIFSHNIWYFHKLISISYNIGSYYTASKKSSHPHISEFDLCSNFFRLWEIGACSLYKLFFSLKLHKIT